MNLHEEEQGEHIYINVSTGSKVSSGIVFMDTSQ
jgi:hypothetical protein